MSSSLPINEPANHSIQRRRQEQMLPESESAEHEQLPKNLACQNSELDTLALENEESLNSNELDHTPSTSGASTFRKQNAANAANHKEAFQIAFDSLNLSGDDSNEDILSDRVAKMLENNKYSDVVFYVGQEEERVYAHKFVLSIGSEVFGTMLNKLHFQQFSTENPMQQEVFVKDIDPEIFKIMLKFLYTDNVQLDPENVMAILYAARKYDITSLELACITFLKTNLCSENAITILKQALFFDLYNLADDAMKIINHDATEILQSESFLEIDQQTLSTILQNDTLRIKELHIYKTVVRWAEAQCKKRSMQITDTNLREVLGPLLFQIRFPLMTPEEFTSVAQFSNILTDKEKLDMYFWFMSSTKPDVPFSTEKRCEIFGKELVVNRFQRIESRWGYTGTTDKIKFTVDVPVFITAIGLYGSMHGDNQHSIKIKLIDFSTNKVLGSNELIFQSNGNSEPFRVPFKEPIEVSSGCTYVISALLNGSDTWFGSKGLRRIARQSIIGNTSGVITFQFSYAAGNNNGTSVDDGQIPQIYFCVKMA